MFVRAFCAVVRGFADGVFRSEHFRAEDRGLGEVERFACEVVDGTYGVGGFCLLSTGRDGSCDLESVEHEGGAFAIHGLIVEGADNLSDGEQDGGGVFEGRYVGVALVHADELHVEEAVGLAIQDGEAAALTVVFDVAALVEHVRSPSGAGRWFAAGYPSPPGEGLMFSIAYGRGRL